MLKFEINEGRCIRCGRCAVDCPMDCIALEAGAGDDGKRGFPRMDAEERCFRCQHCLAVCPTGALSILGVNPDECLPLENGLPTTDAMELLIKGRRSTRHFKGEGLPAETLSRLLDVAWHAPTGANVQGVQFTATSTPEVTDAFRGELYTQLKAKLAETDPVEDDMILGRLRMVVDGYHGKSTQDRILVNAPHVLVVSAPRAVPVPRVDSVIAMTTFELLAQTMGVGTLWNGLLKMSLTQLCPDLAKLLGVPEDHDIAYAMCFGRPAFPYHRAVKRGPANVNLLTAIG